jgi:hypothetical protein
MYFNYISAQSTPASLKFITAASNSLLISTTTLAATWSPSGLSLATVRPGQIIEFWTFQTGVATWKWIIQGTGATF